MYKIARDEKFFDKQPLLREKFKEILHKLIVNPFERTLKTHKLKGELGELYSCSLSYEYRIILHITIADKTIYLVDIGSHDEVY